MSYFISGHALLLARGWARCGSDLSKDNLCYQLCIKLACATFCPTICPASHFTEHFNCLWSSYAGNLLTISKKGMMIREKKVCTTISTRNIPGDLNLVHIYKPVVFVPQSDSLKRLLKIYYNVHFHLKSAITPDFSGTWGHQSSYF